jgi:ComF family protein
MDRLLTAITALTHLCLPQRCILCRQLSHNHSNLCDYCQSDLNHFDYSLFDNLLLRPDIARGISGVQFDTLISLAPYQWPYNQWVADMKFRENFAVAQLMATLLSERLAILLKQNPSLRPQVILPMPVHPLRRFSRGYNQAGLLADVVAAKLNLPLDNDALKRHKPTTAQSGLNKSDRKSNIKNAFIYSAKDYHHVAIIDDVLTTAATVNETCKVLRAQGVTTISVWTIGVTLSQQPQKNTNC